MKKKSTSAPVERNVFGYSDLYQDNHKFSNAGPVNPIFNPGALKRIKTKQQYVLRKYTVMKNLYYLIDGNKLFITPGTEIIFNAGNKRHLQIR